MTPLPRVVILGAGPAGLGAAFKLRQNRKAEVTVLEQGSRVGGNAGSIPWQGHRVDFGSHRLHPACAEPILDDIKQMLGDDLLVRPRHGRILLRGRWIHFPLRPVDLLLRLDKRFAISAFGDIFGRRQPSRESTFASVLHEALGPTICEHFYFPYAQKIWGVPPDALSGIQAQRRVGANSFGRLLRKVVGSVPGFRGPMTGHFYYPADGFGQISEAYAERSVALGATVALGWRAEALAPPKRDGNPWLVTATREGTEQVFPADHVWSTLPLPVLVKLLGSEVPSEVVTAASSIRYRAMLLIYLELDSHRFTPYDAHYFPNRDVRITRLSEPKNYAARETPAGSTVLCAELPTATEDPEWSQPDELLGELVVEDLRRAGLPEPGRPRSVKVVRLAQAYPIYDQGYEAPFGVLDRWTTSLPRLLTYGRQGLFAHDNTHHALAMAYAAAECLGPEEFDSGRWARYRDEFTTHVVED